MWGKQIRLSLLNKALKTLGLLVLVFLFKNSFAQNLIVNGSFESYTNNSFCGTGDISVVNNWSSLSSPDYFNKICLSPNYSVPTNFFGVSHAVNGNAYVGLLGYYKPSEVKEYMFQYLNQPLINGKKYYVSYYVSLADGSPYSIKKLGAYFSISQPTLSMQYLSVVPQIENQTNPLNDTIGWTKIEGYFTAQGGEQYITIGNFNSNANSDTLHSGTSSPIPFEPDEAYYYIDSVSLYDSLTITGINELKKELQFNLYPNPNNGSFILNYDLGNSTAADLIVFDAKGVEIIRIKLVNSSKQAAISSDKFTNGVYYYSIKTENDKPLTNKFVIIK